MADLEGLNGLGGLDGPDGLDGSDCTAEWSGSSLHTGHPPEI